VKPKKYKSETELGKVDKALWRYLFKYGGLEIEVDYFGGVKIEYFNNDLNYPKSKKTPGLLKRIEAGEVNWYRTAPLHDEYTSVFNGTFAEEKEYEYYMEGTLVMNDGKEYKCACKVDKGSMAQNMRDIHGFMAEFGED